MDCGYYSTGYFYLDSSFSVEYKHMLIPPRIISFPLQNLEQSEYYGHWNYCETVGTYGFIHVNYGNDKFNWNPVIEMCDLRLCEENGSFMIPLFRYDSSRKNMKPFNKWTSRQILSFREHPDAKEQRPYDLIGYFDVHYFFDKLPVIQYNPYERIPWNANK